MGWLSAIGLGLSLFQGFRSHKQAGQASQAGWQQAQFNAQQANYFGQLNAGFAMEAAGHNAAMVREIGELNAWYIERAGERNLKMYGIQSDEEKRRHIRAEKMHAGAVRAAQSGSGIQVNTGSNLRYLNDQIDEGLRQRHFMLVRHAETKSSIKMDYTDRAYVERKGAALRADAIMANGAIAADQAMAEAQYQSNSYLQQGMLAQQAGSQAQSNAMWGMFGDVGKFLIGSWGGGGFGDLSNIFSFSKSTPSAPPTLLQAPGYGTPPLLSQNAPAYNPIGKYTSGSYLTGIM